MTLVLSEQDVVKLLPMKKAIEAVKFGLNELADKRAQNQPRRRVNIGTTTLNVMAASLEKYGILGAKNYTTTPEGPTAYFLLYSVDGDLLCLMEADELGRIRTGATTGLATDYLARKDAETAALLGTGYQAETQLLALCAVRDLKKVRVWSRRESSVQAFCKKLQKEVEAELVPVTDVSEAVDGAQIVTTATSATEPIFKGEWLKEGTHLNAVGNNRSYEREVDGESVRRADIIFTDSIEQSKQESGDLLLAAEEGISVWDRVADISELIAGRAQGRKNAEDITMFKSNGLAIEDISVAYTVYEEAKKAGIGHELD